MYVHACMTEDPLNVAVSGSYLFTNISVTNWLRVQAQALLHEEVQHFAQENRLMTSVQVADNDVLELNVGGSLMTTKRSTLTQVGIFRGILGYAASMPISQTSNISFPACICAGQRDLPCSQIQWALGTMS